MKIILIRHGITDWNLARRYQGQTDVPLNEKGRDQARELGRMLADTPIEAIYASDLARAYETAQIIAEGREIPIHKTPGLRETHFGHWEGLTIEEIREKFPEDVERMKKEPIEGIRPGGESRGIMFERVKKTVHEIAEKHPSQTIAIVAHEGSISAATCVLMNEEFRENRQKYRLDNTSYNILEKENGRWHLRHQGMKSNYLNRT